MFKRIGIACCCRIILSFALSFSFCAAWAGGEKKIEVACVYYPHWHEYPKGNEWFHKGFNEWEFVKDAKPRVQGQKVPLRPLYGFLDGKNPADVAKEIDLASNAGIDVFLFDWYWYGGEMEPHEDEVLPHVVLPRPRGLLPRRSARAETHADEAPSHPGGFPEQHPLFEEVLPRAQPLDARRQTVLLHLQRPALRPGHGRLREDAAASRRGAEDRSRGRPCGNLLPGHEPSERKGCEDAFGRGFRLHRELQPGHLSGGARMRKERHVHLRLLRDASVAPRAPRCRTSRPSPPVAT